MKEKLILAIDQGTTNNKAIVLDQEGKIIAKASSQCEIQFPRPGWVEQDPVKIWEGVQEVIDRSLEQIDRSTLAAIGISNQRETVLAWDRTSGEPLGKAIVWQCRRSADFCRKLREEGKEPWLRERTGLTADPLFSASKMNWLLREIRANDPAYSLDRLCFGTIDSWLVWKLTSGRSYVTDLSNASRTQLLNLQELHWDQDLLELFGISEEWLPRICHSSEIVGETDKIGKLPAGIPIAGLIGDSHGALLGQHGFLPGSVKATYGTGSSLMSPIQEPKLSRHGLSTTVAWSAGRTVFALEGNISVTGAAMDWLAQIVHVKNAEAVAELAKETESSEGVYLVPAFVGLGAPHWKENARGLFYGMTRGTTAKHLARAALESIAYQVKDVFEAIRSDMGSSLKALLADGGAARNDQLMQLQADLLDCPVLRNRSGEVSALGAAYLAGLSTGVWKSMEQVAELPREFDRFEPMMSSEKREELYRGWQEALAASWPH